MTALCLIRHAHHVHDRVDGQGPWRDLGLSAAGRVQAQALQSRLSASKVLREGVLISSTQRRAMETAAVVAHGLGRPFVADAEFEEWRNEDGTIGGEASFQFFFGYGDASFCRAYPAFGNASITHWRQDEKAKCWVLERLNDVQHVRE